MKTKLILPPTGPYLVRRFTHLMLGLVLFGSGIGMMLNSRLGVPPWDVLHQGLARHLGMTVGIWSIIVSGIVLLGWLPLREPYGVGTLLNGVVIGAVLDLSGLLLPEPDGLTWRIAMLVAGIVTVGFGSGLYIGAQLGPGPRDGLMTGIAKGGPSIRLTRTLIEVTVLAAGWMLGGTFGVGTVAFAVLIGPIVQFFLPRMEIDLSPAPSSR